jgi:Ca2+-transporting ATPase
MMTILIVLDKKGMINLHAIILWQCHIISNLETLMTDLSSSKQGGEELSWHALDPAEILKHWATPVEKGLSSEEAGHRLDLYGPNQLEETPRITFLRMLWEQFTSFIVLLLIVAAVVSAFLGDIKEAAAILAIVILNAGLGVFQERRAEEALAALQKLAAPEAQVVRDGRRQQISSHQLVPGDIVLLEAGNYVPADLRLLEAVNLRIEEAALTGESVPVQKDANITLKADIPLGDRKNTAFMGTLISYGRGQGIVISTGMRTQIGLIARMLQSVEEEPTPLLCDRLAAWEQSPGHVYPCSQFSDCSSAGGFARGGDDQPRHWDA